MIEILKNEILKCDKYDDFVNDKIYIDNICLMICYDNKCDMFLANGMKLTVAKEVCKRIVEQKQEKNFEDKKNSFTKTFIKKFKGKE